MAAWLGELQQEDEVLERVGAEEEADHFPEIPDEELEEGPKKKELFQPYLSDASVQMGLRTGKLLKGVLRVSLAKVGTAYVKPEGWKSDQRDLVVRGKEARNRAVHGDVVIVELLPDQGGALRKGTIDEEEDLRPRANPAQVLGEESDSDEEIVFAAPVLVTEPLPAAASKDVPDNNTHASLARVVSIAEPKGQSRTIVCTLHPNKAGTAENPSISSIVHEDDKVVKAKPTDKRLPWMIIQVNAQTKKALKIPGKLDPFKLWPVQFVAWKETSTLPLGRLKGQALGQAGEVEAEETHALMEHELDSHDVEFSDEQLDEVNEIVAEAQRSYETEVKKRTDLRTKRIFTIDPATARDLDDAIHVDHLPELNQVEVGVHIADVGHFLKLGSITDIEAQRRTTSVYLLKRVLPMLPHGLCNYLCSLNPNEPKLAFSAYFRLCTRTGDLIEDPKPWFLKTAIKSCCRLNYDEVQDVLDGKQIEKPPVYGGYMWKEIESDIFLLYDVCGKVRAGRMGGGALTISKQKMIFHTRESEDGTPTGYHLESHSASHWIIEELMLLANRCVAKHMAFSPLSQVSVLRNHQAPDPKKAESLEKLMRTHLGLNWTGARSAGGIFRSCQDIYRKYGSMLGLCVEMMTMKAGMKQAEYFVYGQEDQSPHHFALNFEYYTHFTSPIRRYPDVMVHRVLAVILEIEKGLEVPEDEKVRLFQDRDLAMDQVLKCNEKKIACRKCSEQLDRAMFCIYLRKRNEWFYTIGTVLAFHKDNHEGGMDDAVTIYCSQLGRESKVRLLATDSELKEGLFNSGVQDTLELPKRWEFRGRGALDLIWPDKGAGSDGAAEHCQRIRTLSCVPIVIIPTNTVPIDYSLFFVSPFHRKAEEVSRDVSERAKKGFKWRREPEEGVEVVFREAEEDDDEDEEDFEEELGTGYHATAFQGSPDI